MGIGCIVVDDMGPMRRTVSLTLQSLGFTDLYEAKNGREAFEKILAFADIPGKQIEIGFVDWNMRPVTGLDLLKMIRQDKRTRDMVFVMITAEQLQDNVIAALQAGVDDYIIKPFTPKVVKEKINNLVRKRSRELRKEYEEFFGRPKGDQDEIAVREENERGLKEFRHKFNKLQEMSAWSSIVPVEIGRLHFTAGDYEEAEKWLRKALAADFGAPEAHSLLAMTLRSLGKIPESVQELEIALIERPHSGELKQRLGEAYLKEGRLDKAMVTLTEAIHLLESQSANGSMASMKNALGQTKLAKGEKDHDEAMKREAVADLSEAVRLDPSLVAAHYNLMVAYKSTGHAREAAQVLERIQSLEPKDAGGWIAMGKAYLERNEKAKAKFAFNKAEALGVGRFTVYEEIAQAYFDRRMYDDSIPYIDRAREINPSDIFSYNLKGIIFRNRADFISALGEYSRAVTLDPSNAGLFFNLGVAHFKAGDKKESLKHFRKVKELDPGFAEADDYLRQLASAGVGV